jgi:hypothetical protein
MTDYIELGKRIVACKHFRFMDGMLTLCGIRIVAGGSDYIIGHRSGPTKDGGGWVDTVDLDGIYPDLSDAATKGCLLQLVREAWGCYSVCTCDMEGYDAYEWVCIVDTERLAPGIEFPHTRHGVTWFEGSDESAAMVVAMEAAP